MKIRFRMVWLLLSVMSACLGGLYSQAPKKSAVAFPSGYRHWTMARTMVIFGNQHPLYNQFGGLHNVYVNDIGLLSLKQGKAYPDGTVFVFDLFDIRSAQGCIETRGRKFVGVMKKNAKLYADTGGWGWEVFQGDEQKGSLNDAKPCFNCHASQKRLDYVFSAYTE